MITIMTILFMIFIWSLCRISKKEVPKAKEDSRSIAGKRETVSDFNISVDYKKEMRD